MLNFVPLWLRLKRSLFFIWCVNRKSLKWNLGCSLCKACAKMNFRLEWRKGIKRSRIRSKGILRSRVFINLWCCPFRLPFYVPYAFLISQLWRNFRAIYKKPWRERRGWEIKVFPPCLKQSNVKNTYKTWVLHCEINFKSKSTRNKSLHKVLRDFPNFSLRECFSSEITYSTAHACL